MQAAEFRDLVATQVRELEAASSDEEPTLLTLMDGGDPVRVKMSIPVCGKALVWLVECLPEGLDIIPVDVPLAKCYDVFSLESLPSLSSWGARDARGLCALRAELKQAFLAHQKRLIATHYNSKVSFNFDAVKHLADLECLVDSDLAHLVFPLFEPGAVIDARLLAVRVHVTIPCSLSSAARAEVALRVPARLKLTATYKPAPLSLDSLLGDYLPTLQSSLQVGWAKRQEFVAALRSHAAVVELDSMDFSRVVVLVKSAPEGTVAGKSKAVVRLLDMSITLDFPDKSPLLMLREFQSARAWSLDPSLYRYSPRWTAQRMGEELLKHALDQSAAPPAAWAAH